MNRRSLSFRVALCGILGALMTALMLAGTLFPLATYLCPMAAGMLLIPIVWEYDDRTCGLLYLAVSLLSLFLAPDKEAAVLFLLFFGWYPILRPRIQHISRKAPRVILKAVLFNGAVCAAYALLLFVLVSPDLWAEAETATVPLLIGLLALGNVTFFFYDRCLLRMTDLYVIRLRGKLFPHSF